MPNELYALPVQNLTSAMPDVLRNGLCATDPHAMHAMDAYMDNANTSGYIERARDWCTVCPVRQECDAYITAVERPIGSWQGMYGGLTPAERFRRANR